MAFSQFPAPAAGGATDTAFATTLTTMGLTYENPCSLTAGVYTLTISPATTNATATFVAANTTIATVKTASGTSTFTLSSEVDEVYITGLAGGTAGAIATITKTAGSLSPADIGSGTLDTITATGTYNQTGKMAVLVIGGGAAGTKGNTSVYQAPNGLGGRAGYINVGFPTVNTAVTVTVGAKGAAAVSNNTNITDPTASSFGNLVTANTLDNAFMANANLSVAFKSWVTTNNGTTGAGGAGSYYQSASTLGQGSGIGTGGTGGGEVVGGGQETNGNPGTAATAATGKGAGGGGGSFAGTDFPNATGRFGSDGSDGVVYVLRGY